MLDAELEDLPIEQKLALAHASGLQRQRLGAFLALDRRLGHFVSLSSEAILTQMRLAWWRDQFAKPVADRPQGDAILDQLSECWAGEERALIALVDGWEALLAEPPLPEEAALEFCSGRAACFGAIARLSGTEPANATHCGVLWAFADLAARISDPDERALVVALAREQCTASLALPFRLRSLRILGSLGKDALENGGGPLVRGRRQILHIVRLGLLGR